jgi:hypothetical protein
VGTCEEKASSCIREGDESPDEAAVDGSQCRSPNVELP